MAMNFETEGRTTTSNVVGLNRLQEHVQWCMFVLPLLSAHQASNIAIIDCKPFISAYVTGLAVTILVIVVHQLGSAAILDLLFD